MIKRTVAAGCRGADMLREKDAHENGFTSERYSAEWEKYGRSARPVRNKIMADDADFIICFRDGKKQKLP